MKKKEIEKIMEVLRKKVCAYIDAISNAIIKTTDELNKLQSKTLSEGEYHRNFIARRMKIQEQSEELEPLFIKALEQPEIVAKFGEELQGWIEIVWWEKPQKIIEALERPEIKEGAPVLFKDKSGQGKIGMVTHIETLREKIALSPTHARILVNVEGKEVWIAMEKLIPISPLKLRIWGCTLNEFSKAFEERKKAQSQ